MEKDVEEARLSKPSGAVSGNMTFLPPLCHLYPAGRSSDSSAQHVAASRGLNKEATVEEYQLHQWTQLNDTARLLCLVSFTRTPGSIQWPRDHSTHGLNRNPLSSLTSWGSTFPSLRSGIMLTSLLKIAWRLSGYPRHCGTFSLSHSVIGFLWL